MSGNIEEAKQYCMKARVKTEEAGSGPESEMAQKVSQILYSPIISQVVIFVICPIQTQS
jgi:hypothetical protein